MVRSLYQFHVYYQVRCLKRLQVPLPYELGFSGTDNPYRSEGFWKLCEDYGVPHDPIGYWNEKFYWVYQQGVSWPDDYIGLDSMIHWIIKKSRGMLMWGCTEYQRASGLMCT